MQQLVTVLSATPRNLVTVLVAGSEEEGRSGRGIGPVPRLSASRRSGDFNESAQSLAPRA